jgi:hypothetical protein
MRSRAEAPAAPDRGERWVAHCNRAPRPPSTTNGVACAISRRWVVLSDTGSESAGGGAAASLLAGFGRVASTGRIELPRGVLAVALRAFRA